MTHLTNQNNPNCRIMGSNTVHPVTRRIINRNETFLISHLDRRDQCAQRLNSLAMRGGGKQLKTGVWGRVGTPTPSAERHTCYGFPVENSSDAIEVGLKKEGSLQRVKLSGHCCPARCRRCARVHGARENVDGSSSR